MDFPCRVWSGYDYGILSDQSLYGIHGVLSAGIFAADHRIRACQEGMHLIE